MSLGVLAVVKEWLDAVNRRDGDRVGHLSHQDVEIVGPRGSVRGRRVLSEWLTSAGFSAEPLRWFCGADGSVVVEQDARWVDVVTGGEQGRGIVASQFLVTGPSITRYARHDELGSALAASGLSADDQVFAPHAS